MEAQRRQNDQKPTKRSSSPKHSASLKSNALRLGRQRLELRVLKVLAHLLGALPLVLDGDGAVRGREEVVVCVFGGG